MTPYEVDFILIESGESIHNVILKANDVSRQRDKTASIGNYQETRMDSQRRLPCCSTGGKISGY